MVWYFDVVIVVYFHWLLYISGPIWAVWQTSYFINAGMQIQINFEQEKFNEEPTEIDSLLKTAIRVHKMKPDSVQLSWRQKT